MEAAAEIVRGGRLAQEPPGLVGRADVRALPGLAPVEDLRVAVELVASRLGDDVDVDAGEAAVLGRRAQADDLLLLDGVVGDGRRVLAAAEPGAADLGAVDGPGIADLVAAAVGAELGHARGEVQDGVRILSRGELKKKVLGDVGLGQRRVGDVDDRGGPDDRHFRLDPGRRQDEVQGRGHAHVEIDVRDLLRGETAHRHFDLVDTGQEPPEPVAPVLIRDGRRFPHDARRAGRDRGAGKRRARVVRDLALDRRRFPRLSREGDGGQEQDHQGRCPGPF